MTAAMDTARRVVPLALALLLAPAPVVADDALWALLKGGGQVVIMRHATTDPGTGDPPGFTLGDCASQRNLNAVGREEARRIGAAFQARRVPVGRVLSSRWCRCLETARLAFGRVEAWPPLDSFFDDRSRGPEQTRAVRERAGDRPGEGNLVLVTHQINVGALTGVYPMSGEMVVLTPLGDGQFRVAGRVPPAALPRP